MLLDTRMRLGSALVIGLGLLLGPTFAEAGKNVDWSQYIEAPGERSRPPVSTSRDEAPASAKRATAKRAKAVKKAKAKARAKAKAKRGSRAKKAKRVRK